MSYLIDTNIISEIRKRKRGNLKVRAWYDSIRSDEIYLSVLVLGEIRKGLERARQKDPTFAQELEQWLLVISAGYSDRILPVDQAVTDEWGRLNTIRDLPVIDSLLGATANIHGLTLVTRNVDDLKGIPVSIMNPFD